MHYIKSYFENGFAIIDNFLPEEEYKKMVKIYKGGKFEKVDIIREGRYKLWETLEDKHFPSDNEEYMAHFWSSFDVADNPKVIGMYDKYISNLKFQHACCFR